jgi:PilZ domain
MTFALRGDKTMADLFVRANSRRHVRHAVDLPCSVVFEKNLTLAGLRAVDLSPDGMRIELSDVEVELGDHFFVCFRTPARWFLTDAFATRLLLGRRRGETRRCLALRFGSLSTALRARIEGDLRLMPPHLPQREQRVDYAATVGRILAQ